MARVTVEDCLKNVKNRFELVIVAAKRARQLMHGKEPKVEWDNDKSTVVALREIAAGYTNFTSTEPEEIHVVTTQAITLETPDIDEPESDSDSDIEPEQRSASSDEE